MEVKYNGKSSFPVKIEFGKIRDYISRELTASKLYSDVDKLMIYNAFLRNPSYYLIKTGFMNSDVDVNENKFIINEITSKFFSYIIKSIGKRYYIMKSGEVLNMFEDYDMAEHYCNRVGCYIVTN